MGKDVVQLRYDVSGARHKNKRLLRNRPVCHSKQQSLLVEHGEGDGRGWRGTNGTHQAQEEPGQLFLFGVCDDALWALLDTPPGGVLRVRLPDFQSPLPLAPALVLLIARDAFKLAMKSRAAWMACSASFCLAILDSIGEVNRLAISDPHTDTLRLSPRDIIIAMTFLHGTMTGAEVDALRQPLKKTLSAVSDLPSHIVAFRGVLANPKVSHSANAARAARLSASFHGTKLVRGWSVRVGEM